MSSSRFLFVSFTASLGSILAQGPGPLLRSDPQRTAFPVLQRASAAVIVADVDGDGVFDAVHAGPAVQWGDGTGFEPGPDLTGAPSQHELVSPPVVFDCDGDGDLDLLQPASAGIPRSLWRNVGGRRFVDATVAVNAPPQADSLQAAVDIDGDGDLDVLGDQGSVWTNDGTGALRDETALRNPGMPTTGAAGRPLVVVFDADGDGDPDVLVRAGLLRNDGAGVFAFDGTVPHDVGRPIAVVPFDIDGDGDLDLLPSDGALLRNDGAGAFVREAFGHDGVRGVGDIDGDGRSDLLLVPNASPAAPAWAPGAATGFGMPRPLPFVDTQTEVDPSTWRVQLSDVDGDRDLDVVASVLSRTQDLPPLLLANDGAGRFEAAYDLNAGGVDVLQAHLVLDVDRDGAVDLVTSRDVYTNDGSGRFERVAAMPAPARRPLCFGDWDGDGDLDLLVAGGVILDNDGSGGFSDRTGGPVVSGRVFETADWDLDGDDDLVSLGSNAITLWENRPGGLVSRTLDTFAAAAAIDMALGDFNGDGRPDVAVLLTSPASQQVTDLGALLQDASGGLVLGPYTALEGSYERVLAGDLDRDGRQDLVATGPAATRGFRQLPNGTFAALQGSLPEGVRRLADLDGDGDVDVLRSGFGVAAFRNDGVGGFSALTYRAPLSCCRLVWDLSVADLDGDGDLDVLFGGRSTAGTTNPANGVYILWNSTRHLQLSGLMAVGGSLGVEVRSALGPSDPSRLALTTIGFARGTLAVAGVGEIGIDLNGAVSMPWAPFGGSDVARTSVAIPLAPALIGLELFVQSATVGAAAPPELTHVAVGRVHG